MSEKKLAYDFWNTPEGIRSQKIFDMRDRIRRLEASNKELRELVCEFGVNIADQDYLLRPDTISRTIKIMVEEKEKDGWYGNKLKEKQGGYSNE